MSVVLRVLAVLSVLAALLVGGGPSADAAPSPEPTAVDPVATARATPTATVSGATGRTPTPSASPTRSRTPLTTPGALPTATPGTTARPTPSPTASPTATPRVADPRTVTTRAVVRGEIGAKWMSLGGIRSDLGEPLSNEICGLRDGGCFQIFNGGSIYWTPTTGARVVRGAIGDLWASQGWETGQLGYPTSDELCGLRDGGCMQRFRGGDIYWSPTAGAATLWGAIGKRYATLGWENSALGYPVAAEQCGLVDGGCVQRFAGGNVYFSRAGTFAVWGAIADRFASVAWERGQLGYPTSAEGCDLVDGGCVQRFAGGNVYASKAGTFAVWGAIADRFASLAWENGQLGYPGRPRSADCVTAAACNSSAEETSTTPGPPVRFRSGVPSATATTTAGWSPVASDIPPSRSSADCVTAAASSDTRAA
ncbi:hypothetical protein CGZ93_10685 [Enemella dayhoffiae]|uniref:LGFP repeat-containing protein n=1 Tax=Enemella dayhoffiae TaxID=2016507 RepID=A0A255H1U5_9ACTN|nr:hypothetical protein [Enemella dayhoffiae]OYO21243.1 hypothetical protein CGZ93_10685 [Enemella dayhoffiae]